MAMKVIRQMYEQKVSGGSITLLRITLGFVFLTTSLSNILKGGLTSSGYINIINSVLTQIDPIRTIIQTIVFPNASILAPSWMLMEISIGISLIFGILTRPVSIIGAIVSTILMMTTLGNDWIWSYIMMIVGFLTCAFVGAGRWYGLDFWLKDKLPSKIRKLLV